MFIERSTAKIRGVRTLFVLLGLLPCAALIGLAVVRHSASHRDGIRRAAEQAIGMPVDIDAVEHVRPGAMRLRGCCLRLPEEGGVVQVTEVEVETSATEVRLRIPSVSCDPAGVAALAGVARAWLDEPVRFPRAWVVEIGSLSWDVDGFHDGRRKASPAPGAVPGVPLRIECVSAGGSRAVRVHRADGSEGEDELRVIAIGGSPRGYEVHASIQEAIPWGIVRSILPQDLMAGVPLGSADAVAGVVEASTTGQGWMGTARGMIEGIDMAELAAMGRHRMEGTLTLSVDRLQWRGGRIVAIETTGSAVRGRIAQSLLGALVTNCGCRAGPAFQSLAGEEMRPFDDLEVRVGIDAGGVTIAAGANRAGALARRQGLSLIDEPTGAVPADRLAWLVGPADAPAVPVSAASSWLMRLLPSPAPSGRREENTATRPNASTRQAGGF